MYSFQWELFMMGTSSAAVFRGERRGAGFSFRWGSFLLLYPGRLYRFVLVCGLDWVGLGVVVVVFYFCTMSAGEQQQQCVFDVPRGCNIGCADIQAKPSSLPFPRVTAAGCCQGFAERRGVGLITHWHWMEPIGLAIRATDWTNGIGKWGSLLIFFRVEATELVGWGPVLSSIQTCCVSQQLQRTNLWRCYFS